MSRTTKCLTVLVEKRLSETDVDLTLKQFILLYKVSEEGRTQSELALITERDKGSLTRLIQSLERKDFVKRASSDSDRRINIVEATACGLKAMKKAKKTVMKVFDELTEELSEKESKAMIKTAKKLMSRSIELINRP
jgi:DNA-binding MarR family transcriptional regulator